MTARSLGQIIAALEAIEGGWRGTIPANWLQGRTAYGGLSTALAHDVARRALPDLPRLRSAQIAFIGPLAGSITLLPTLLRRGRNAAFVQVDVTGEAGLGLRATFVFMATGGSAIDHRVDTAPACPRPVAGDPSSFGIPEVVFTQNFEFVEVAGDHGAAAWLRWIRLRERDGLDPVTELLAVADCLPPAALKLVGRPAPASSMTWLVNLLMPAPVTKDGWWLLHAASDHASGNGSSQRMAMWNADHQPVAEQMQGVAIFA